MGRKRVDLEFGDPSDDMTHFLLRSVPMRLLDGSEKAAYGKVGATRYTGNLGDYNHRVLKCKEGAHRAPAVV